MMNFGDAPDSGKTLIFDLPMDQDQRPRALKQPGVLCHLIPPAGVSEGAAWHRSALSRRFPSLTPNRLVDPHFP